MDLFSAIVLALLVALGASSALDPSNFTSGVWPLQSFKSAPEFTPPFFNITKSGADLAPGYIFVTPLSFDGAVQSAALIMTDTGDLIWNAQPGNYTAMVKQSLDSQPVLTYWTGGAVASNGYGHISILNESYSEIYRVCPDVAVVTAHNETFPCYADSHENFITERGSIIITVVNITTADLRPVFGPENGWVYDIFFLEVDIKTNKTLFRWSPIDAGIPFTDSKAPLGVAPFGDGKTQATAWDWFRMNSVQSVGDGYLVNGRHLWTTFKLNSTGDIEWRIQGDTGGDFKLPEDGHFAWEHYARIQNVTSTDATIHYMNNFNVGATFNGSGNGRPSEGLELHLDLTTKTATVLKNLVDKNDVVLNPAQGTFDPLPNGNTLLGYGQIPVMKEFGPDSNDDVRMTISSGLELLRTPPVLVVESDVLYMSWNGATGITSWAIFAGESEQDLKVVGMVDSMGFETMFKIQDGCEKVLKVAAYRRAELLRDSNIVVVA